nr:hypothetical protein LOCMHKOF_00058 [Providencia stuartii]
MDENKLNIETVDGHNELVVSFLSRMVSLSDEEKQTVLSCLPDTGKQTITQLYEALRSQGHQDLAEKVEPYLQQGVFGPIFDNAKSKVFVRDEAPFFLMDENPLNWDDAKAFNRLRMSTTCVLGRGGWTIGERFDDRFDTEVGGTQLIVTQSLNEKGEIEGGLPTSMSLNDFAEFPKQPRPPQIVDYQEDKRYTLEEAEAIPELAPVVQRLKERIEEYEERRAHDWPDMPPLCWFRCLWLFPFQRNLRYVPRAWEICWRQSNAGGCHRAGKEATRACHWSGNGVGAPGCGC